MGEENISCTLATGVTVKSDILEKRNVELSWKQFRKCQLELNRERAILKLALPEEETEKIRKVVYETISSSDERTKIALQEGFEGCFKSLREKLIFLYKRTEITHSGDLISH